MCASWTRCSHGSIANSPRSVICCARPSRDRGVRVTVPGFCRDCLTRLEARESVHCHVCGSARLLRHPELFTLSLAHLDCDAFYAAVEKRDDPSLDDKPVIVGGRQRGVAMTCCYVARRFGVRNAMPVYKALELCPDAVIIPPDMAKYARVSGDVRTILESATPLVEPMSLDEAFLDLSGTEATHGAPPAIVLARLAKRIESEIGITISIGLSHNKLIAKMASELEKPRGFGVVGRSETLAFLAAKRVRALPGVGPRAEERLAAQGITTIADLQSLGAENLRSRYGAWGERLGLLARGDDRRDVVPDRDASGMSAETTFARDLSAKADLERELWPLCEKLSRRLKRGDAAAAAIVLKLKTANFRIHTRSRTLASPTQLADTLFRIGCTLLAPEIGKCRYRLIGIGAGRLAAASEADPPDLFTASSTSRAKKIETALDAVRERFGTDAIGKGRGIRRKQ